MARWYGKILAGVFVCLVAGTVSAITIDLAQNTEWVVAESRNFMFISEQPLQGQLQALADDCEHAYTDLSPALQWRFSEKVTVLFTDRTDRHNGWAMAYPRASLMLIAAPPRNESFLFGPSDHRRRTIYHELTHLLLLDANYGFISRCNRIFGRVSPDLMDPLSLLMTVACMPPANAAPSWFMEGLAIWAETRYAGPGRGRNADVDAMFRTAVDQNRLWLSNRWHLRAPEWPFGNSAYLYGMKAIEESARIRGKSPDADRPGRLGHAVTTAPVAGFFNSQALDVQNRDFETIADDAWSREKAFQKTRIDRLRSRPLTDTPRWSPLDEQVRNPAWTPDGEIWAVVSSDNRKSRLARVDRMTRTLKDFGPLVTPGWTRTATDYQTGDILFTRLDGAGANEWRSRLYRFDPGTGMTGPVHLLYRVMDLGTSMNGRLAVVQRTPGGDSLDLFRWEPKKRFGLIKVRGVVQAETDDILSSPVFTRDSNTLYYIHTQPGRSSVMRWSCSGDSMPQPVWSTGNSITSLDLWNGSIPVICTDLSGVFNLYRLDPGQPDPVPLTHSFGGLHDARFSPDGKELAASSMDADGFFVTIIPASGLLSPGESPVEIPPAWSLPDARVPAPTAHVALSPITAYEPLSRLDFDYWTPWLSVNIGYAAGGVVARWSDPTLSHRLLVYAGMESLQDEVIGAAHWQYAKTWPQWSVYLARKAPVYNGLMEDREGRWFDYEETLWDLTLSGGLEWDTVHFETNLEGGWQFVNRSCTDAALWSDAVESGMFEREPLIDGLESTLWMTASINTATAYPRSLSLEDGTHLAASFDWTDPALGSDLRRTRFRADGAVWLQLLELKHHILKVSASYGTASGDRTAQGAFAVSGYDDLGPGNPPGFSSAMILRGYPANMLTGERAAALGLAYRFPVMQRFRSISSRSIVYLTQVTGEIFWETASAWDRGGNRDWFRSYGAEINMGAIWFSAIDLAPGVGVCWLPDYLPKDEMDPGEKGDWSAYLSLKTTIAF